MDWSCYKGNLSWLRRSTIFLTLHGSHAYGTNLPSSDIDWRGVCVPPKVYFTGLERFDQVVQTEPDLTIFGIQKFLQLACQCNPNVLEILYTDPGDHAQVGKAGHELLDSRHLFLTQRAKRTFSGYAMSQLKRIKTHRQWLMNPPKFEPRREDYEIPAERLVGKSEIGCWVTAVKEVSPIYTEMMLGEKKYLNAKQHWDQYQNWLKTRNPARAELETKHGYDTKHAMHLVRLMTMCREIMAGQGMIVKRPDAEMLLEIRAGAWEYDKLIEFAETADKEIQASKSELPWSPDMHAVNDLCMRVVEMGWRDGV